jgi:hypothetical protein
VFDVIKTSSVTFKNPDGGTPSIGSILQTNDIFGTATFTSSITCDEIITTRADISSMTVSYVTVTRLTTGPVISDTDIQISDTSGDIVADYIASDNGKYSRVDNYILPDEQTNLILEGANSSLVGNSSNYLALNNGALLWQQTSGKNALTTKTLTTDIYTNIIQWISAFAQTSSAPLLSPSASTVAIINTLNTLILTIASRGVLLKVRGGPAKPVIDSSGLRVDLSGFTVSWTSVPFCTYAVLLDDRVYSQNFSATQYSFTGFSQTNNFPYIVKIAAIDTMGRYAFSDPFPVVIRNINSNPKDLENFYGTFGQGPSSQAYYRATSPNAINYITVSTDPTILPTNQIQNKFVLLGSNASATTPIQIRYWEDNSYLISSLKITNTIPYFLRYNTTDLSWQIWP